jgi:hypothetical protein
VLYFLRKRKYKEKKMDNVIYFCWICLEISVTRTWKILKNLLAACGARRGLVWPVGSVDWRGRAGARRGLVLVWRFLWKKYF